MRGEDTERTTAGHWARAFFQSVQLEITALIAEKPDGRASDPICDFWQAEADAIFRKRILESGAVRHRMDDLPKSGGKVMHQHVAILPESDADILTITVQAKGHSHQGER